MKPALRPLHEQVIVITGATSGIGLTTSRAAAKRGARLILNARNQQALEQLAAEIASSGGHAASVVGDVSNIEDVKRIASRAVEQYGGFDTWVNNAGISIYGRVTDVQLEDHRKLFETNYWGVVHGSIVAAQHLRNRGGAIINIGSVLSDRAIPLQGTYCASKHAVKGFTDALRMELEKEGAPISVSLVKPSSIDTPYRQHAKLYMPVEPLNPPPVYAPDVVAGAILHCAEHPTRDVTVGGGGKLLSLSGTVAPILTDLLMRTMFFGLQKSSSPAPTQRSNSLHAPSDDGQQQGGYPGYVFRSSAFTTASLHPLVTSAAVALLATAGFAAWRSISPAASSNSCRN